MSTRDLIPYLNKSCRFKLKSGKEVFGIIWEAIGPNGKHLYFTSLSNAELVYEAGNSLELAAKIGNPIPFEDIIYVEKLAS